MKEYIINNKSYRLNIFDKLEPSSAYLIGYLCGDGAFNKKTHKKHEKLSICSKELSTIEWIRDNFTPDATIGSVLPINKKRNIVTENLSYRLALSSLMSPIFKKYGVLNIKKERICVGISKIMFINYLKGLIDSDGHFSSGKRKDRNRVWMNFGITHQSTSVLNSVQKYLHEELNISSFVNQRKDEDCLDLKVSNIESVVKLINWLYSTNDCPFVKKYQSDKCLALYIEKKPNAT